MWEHGGICEMGGWEMGGSLKFNQFSTCYIFTVLLYQDKN